MLRVFLKGVGNISRTVIFPRVPLHRITFSFDQASLFPLSQIKPPTNPSQSGRTSETYLQYTCK